MKISHKVSVGALAVSLTLGFALPLTAFAATSPSLGTATSFSVIGATGITGTVPTSGITGNVGNPAGGQITNLTALMVGGTIQSFNQVAPATTLMNANVMTDLTAAYTFLDIGGDNATCKKASDGSSGTDTGVIELGGKSLVPGVYCTSGSFGITTGAGPLTLVGTTGTWIFKAAEGITTDVSSVVTGGDPCNVWWRMGTAAAGLGDTSTFIGTIIAHTGITFGVGVTLNGRALAEGANVTLNSGGHISGPTCSGTPPPVYGCMDSTATNYNSSATSQTGVTCTYAAVPSSSHSSSIASAPATLHVIKHVVNNGGGTATASSFAIHVKIPMVPVASDVIESPAAGVEAPGTSYRLSVGTYLVSEDANALYYTSFSGDCNSSGSVTLSTGADKTCTITNTDKTVTTATTTPKLPNTGLPPQSRTPWDIFITAGILMVVSISLVLVLKKRTV